MSKILPFYESVLKALRYQVNDEGLISYINPTGKATPAMVDGKRLVLPTKTFMKEGFGEEFQPFHPLSESIARRGTSPVQQHMQRVAKANIAVAVQVITTKMMEIAADPTLHKDLPPRSADFLKKLADVSDKTLDIFNQLVRAANKQNQLLVVYLKNGGTYEGKKVNRLTVIRFPIIELIDSDAEAVCGVKIPKKHRPAISALFHLVLPFGESAEEYSAGSNNRTAPYLHSFLLAYHKIATQLNRVIGKYNKALEFDVGQFDLYDEESLKQFADIYDELPALNGNQGETDVLEEASETVKPAAEQKITQSGLYGTTATSQTQTQSKPAAASDKSISVADLMNTLRPQQQQPVYAQQQQSPYGVNNGNMALNNLNAMLGVQQPQQQASNPFAAAFGVAPAQATGYGTGHYGGSSSLI